MTSAKVCIEAWQGFRQQAIEGADPGRRDFVAEEKERVWNISIWRIIEKESVGILIGKEKKDGRY